MALGLVLLVLVAFGLFTVATSPVAKAERAEEYKGPWVGEVRFYEEPDEAIAIEKLIAGGYDAYFDQVSTATVFKRVKEAGLLYSVSYGLYYEITLNYRCVVDEKTGEIKEPVFPNPSKFPDPKVEGKRLFNPFCNPKIRYAMHFLINREFLAEKVAEGMAIPRYTAITPAFPDYGRFADAILSLERELAYDFAKARQIIFEEMAKMGAEYKDGKWYYKGEPVILIFLIRTEDIRRQIGDYVASQLERLGFTVLRVYGTSAMLRPYWITADPDDGTFHLYTGAWITEIVMRDEAENFAFFYTKLGQPGLPLWDKIINTPEFYEVARKLAYKEFKTIEERNELFRKALVLSVTAENQRIFILHSIAAWPRRPNIELAADLAGGYSGSWLWAWTIRFTDIPKEENRDKVVRLAMPQLLVEPWNPIGGSNWVFDQSPIRATGEYPFYYDPFSGLVWPHRIERAEVYVKEGLPVTKTLDWVKVEVVSGISVPDDAWLFYDCKNKKIWTVGEARKNPDIIKQLFGETVEYKFEEPPLVKVVVYFDNKTLTEYKWHDGSTFDLADIVYAFIMTFDRVCTESSLYDETAVPTFESWFPTFKGFRIVQTNPLVIEEYSTMWYMDAEVTVANIVDDFWPYYTYGPGAWHTVELFAYGERQQIVAFTESKSKSLNVPRADYLNPPAPLIDLLKKFMEENYIPYKEVLGAYLTPEEARARWNNLLNWYNKYKHLWVGNGPFYLESFTTAPKTIVLKAFREHPDSASKWEFLAEPPVPVISVEVPATVERGKEVVVSLELTDRAGSPYPNKYVEFVSYVIMHAGGVVSGKATPIAEGLWEVRLTPDITSKLSAGVAEIKFIAVSKLVGLPTIESKTITVTIAPEEFLKEIEEVRKSVTEELSHTREELMATLGETVATAFESLGKQLNSTLGVVGSSIDAVTRQISDLKNTVESEAGSVRDRVSSVERSVSEDISRLEGSVSSLSTILYIIVALVVVNLVVGIVTIVFVLKRK